jgi:hypothetical protein
VGFDRLIPSCAPTRRLTLSGLADQSARTERPVGLWMPKRPSGRCGVAWSVSDLAGQTRPTASDVEEALACAHTGVRGAVGPVVGAGRGAGRSRTTIDCSCDWNRRTLEGGCRSAQAEPEIFTGVVFGLLSDRPVRPGLWIEHRPSTPYTRPERRLSMTSGLHAALLISRSAGSRGPPRTSDSGREGVASTHTYALASQGRRWGACRSAGSRPGGGGTHSDATSGDALARLSGG